MNAGRRQILAVIGCLALLGTAAIAQAEITQNGTLRLDVNGNLAPRSLPRDRAVPISISIDWGLSTTDESAVPQLMTLKVEINRHGHFDTQGLPTCEVSEIQPATTTKALSICHSSLVGKGTFSAKVALNGQVPYSTGGRLVVFNGKRHGKSVLLGQIYSAHPFPTSFVITFELGNIPHGTYGKTLTATLPAALRNWGNLTGIEMTLSRRFSYRGRNHSYISAGCPAPKGFPGAVFPLARTSFAFAGGKKLTTTVSSDCKARG